MYLGIDASQRMIFGVGTNWSTPWRSYVQKASVSGGKDRAYVVNGDASMRLYSLTGDNVSSPDYEMLNTLQHQAAVPAGHDERFVLTQQGGTIYYYDQAQDFPDELGNTKTLFLLGKTQEPSGATTTFAYSRGAVNNELLLTSVTDSDGQTTTFSYVSKGPYLALISQVNGPFGLTTSLNYDNNGFLTNITDTVGLWSAMTYNSSNRLATLQTPYGTNQFTYVYPTGTYEWYGLRVTEQNIRKHFWICGNLPSTLDIIPQAVSEHDSELVTKVGAIPGYGIEYFDYLNLYKHNSLHWGPQQYENLPGALKTGIEAGTFTIADLTTNHVNLSLLKHYLQKSTATYISAVVSLEKAPSASAAGDSTGLVTYYDHPSKPRRDLTGTVRWPKCQAYKTSASDWRILYWDYNSAGLATTKIDNYTETDGSEAWRKETFAYDSNGIDLVEDRIWTDFTTTSHLGESNQWNSAHQPVIRFVGPEQPPTFFTYDSLQRLTNMITPTGLMTEYQFDANGFPSKTIDYTGSVSPVALRTNQFSYVNGQPSSMINPRGLQTTYSYDSLWRVLTTRFPSDNTGITNIYNKLDIAVVRDRMGFTNQFFYNGFRNVLYRTNANFNVTTYAYNCNCGALTDIADPLGNTIHYDYDNLSRVTKTTIIPNGQMTGTWVQKGYNDVGQVLTITDGFGRTVTRTYNLQGLQNTEVDGTGTLSWTIFDVENNAVQTFDKNGVVRTQTFDGLHRTLTRSFTGGGTETFGYSARGLIGFTNAVTTNTWVMDVYGRKLQSLTIANPTTSWNTTNDFSPGGDLITMADPRLKKTTWSYDVFGRNTDKRDHAGSVVFSYGYDANSRLISRTAPASTGGGNITTSYTYDSVGNLLTVVYPSSPTLTFKYDGNNRMTNMVDGVGTSSFTYNEYGAPLTEDGPWVGDKVTYSYNAARARSGLSLSQPNATDWVQAYGYDTGERLTGVASPAGSFAYTYKSDHHSMIEKLSLPSGNWITNDYDQVARLIRTHLTGSTGVLTNKHEYTYNLGNQRTVQTRGDAVTSNDNAVSYSYDGLGELLSASGTESGGSIIRTNEQFGYLYDSGGNLLSRTNGVSTSANKLVQSFAVNDLNQLTSGSRSGTMTVAGLASGTPTIAVTVKDNANAAATATVFKDKSFARSGIAILNGNNTFVANETDGAGRTDSHTVTVSLPSTLTFSYDSRGNLTNDGNRALFYNEENQLTAVQVNTQWRSEFTYDGKMRLRARREYKANGASWTQTNECRYVYDSKLPIQERDANNIPQVSYTRGLDLSGGLQGAGGIGGLLARSDSGSGSHAYYHADGNGNITMMVNEKSAIVAKYLYDPYGSILGMAGALAEQNLYRFSSKEAHPTSGIIYYLYRFYDPNLQRWPNRDPLGESVDSNLYRFVLNSPIGYVDPVGLRHGPHWLGCYGKVCVSPKCTQAGLNGVTYVPEDPPPGLHQPPPPGNCVEADAVYYPGGADKVGDFDTITVECDDDGKFKGISGKPAGHWDAPPAGQPPEPPPPRWPSANIPPYETLPPNPPGPTVPPITPIPVPRPPNISGGAW